MVSSSLSCNRPAYRRRSWNSRIIPFMPDPLSVEDGWEASESLCSFLWMPLSFSYLSSSLSFLPSSPLLASLESSSALVALSCALVCLFLSSSRPCLPSSSLRATLSSVAFLKSICFSWGVLSWLIFLVWLSLRWGARSGAPLCLQLLPFPVSQLLCVPAYTVGPRSSLFLIFGDMELRIRRARLVAPSTRKSWADSTIWLCATETPWQNPAIKSLRASLRFSNATNMAL